MLYLLPINKYQNYNILMKLLVFHAKKTLLDVMSEDPDVEFEKIIIKDIVFPIPYQGFFWNKDKKVFLSDYDAILMFGVDESHKRAYDFFSPHILTIGNPYSRSKLASKYYGPLTVANAGIPVIPYIDTVTHGFYYPEHFKDFTGDFVVEKTEGNCCGNEVLLKNIPTCGVPGSENESFAIHASFGSDGYSRIGRCILYQQFIECDAKDQRWICAGDKIVCAMERRAENPGEFRANISQGGSGMKIDVTPEMAEMAKKIADLFPGYVYGGFDIITDKSGKKYFVEGNAMVGEIIIQVCSYNYCIDIWQYIKQQIYEAKPELNTNS